MMDSYQPNYQNIVDACYNRHPARIPLYDHSIHASIIEKLTGASFAHLLTTDPDAYFAHYCSFFRDYGYDTVTYEANTILILPNGGALSHNREGAIQTREDFDAYPFDQLCDIFFDTYGDRYRALRKHMPQGMMAIGGVGNGIFEVVQDLVGYEELCYISLDDPALFADLFATVGKVMLQIWSRFLHEFGDIFCACRFGDDLGFNTATLLAPDVIRTHIIPQYQPIVDLVHRYNKPFLLHSCGSIFHVMDDLIATAGIDSKHSNEDAICDYADWITTYGDRIGNFGGIDTGVICELGDEDVQAVTTRVYHLLEAKQGGGAIGSGNSIPDYASPEKYLCMLNTVRNLRGDFD